MGANISRLKCRSRYCYAYEELLKQDFSTFDDDTLIEIISYCFWVSTEIDLPDEYWEECVHLSGKFDERFQS